MSTSAPCQFLQGQRIALSAFKVDLVAISRTGQCPVPATDSVIARAGFTSARVYNIVIPASGGNPFFPNYLLIPSDDFVQMA